VEAGAIAEARGADDRTSRAQVGLPARGGLEFREHVRPAPGRQPLPPVWPQPNGLLIFLPNGHISLINTRPGRPKFAAHNRMAGTPEENQAAVHGVVAYFGTYTVDGAT
jgi:hypothetical protein